MKPRVACAIVLPICLAACVQHRPAPPPPEDPVVELPDAVSLSDVFLLDAGKEAELIALAGQGDGEAAHRLSLHYKAIEDGARAGRWLRTAAGLGEAAAQYSLWFELRDASDCTTRREAHAWLLRAADQGFEPARDDIASSARSMNACDH